MKNKGVWFPLRDLLGFFLLIVLFVSFWFWFWHREIVSSCYAVPDFEKYEAMGASEQFIQDWEPPEVVLLYAVDNFHLFYEC